MLVLPVNALRFIDSLASKKHLMLAYSKPSYAKMLEYCFIKNGLLQKEHCIVLTHNKTKSIKDEMLEHGIDVQKYEEMSLLHVYQIPDPTTHPGSILDGFKEVVKMILSDSKPPYRIVGRIMPNIRTEEGIAITHHFEELFHTTFDSFGGSVFCTYELDEIKENNQWQQWLSKLKNCHHASIIQTKDGKELITFHN